MRVADSTALDGWRRADPPVLPATGGNAAAGITPPAAVFASLVADEVQRQLAAAGLPMRAALDTQVSDLESRVGTLESDRDELRRDVDDLDGRFTRFQAEQIDEDSITLPEAVDELEDDVRILEQRVEELVAEKENQMALGDEGLPDAGAVAAPAPASAASF